MQGAVTNVSKSHSLFKPEAGRGKFVKTNNTFAFPFSGLIRPLCIREGKRFCLKLNVGQRERKILQAVWSSTGVWCPQKITLPEPQALVYLFSKWKRIL